MQAGSAKRGARRSVLAESAIWRVGFGALGLGLLWIAVVWAGAVP